MNKEMLEREFGDGYFTCWNCNYPYFEKVTENEYRCKNCKKISILVLSK